MNAPLTTAALEPLAKNGASATAPYLYPELVFALVDEAGTAALAAIVARFAVVGDLIRLEGDLGAGKSTFARYFLEALGHKGEVPSPTYTLVQMYSADNGSQARLPVAHVDCYRLENPAELDGLGLEDYLMHGVVLAEWPEKGGEILAHQPAELGHHIQEMNNPGLLTVAFAPGQDPATARVVTVSGSQSWQRRFGFICPGIRRGAEDASPEPGRRRFLDGLGLKGYQIEPLGADWGMRSYGRVTLADGQTRMLMDATPPIEAVQEFAQVSTYYQQAGLRAPKIYGTDEPQGYLLLEDFGTRQLLTEVQQGLNPTPWYEVAIEALVKLCQSQPMDGVRSFSARDFWVDAARFTDWYLPLARGYGTPPAERRHYQDLWMAQYERLLKLNLPQGVLPWDYQATNMMLLAEKPALENFGLIDFQDARMAPLAMDMAILLRDIRRNQNDTLEHTMVAYAAKQLGIAAADLCAGLEIANLHHCSRILGGLSRILVRDGKLAGPQKFIPRTWEVARQSFGVPELAELVAFMAPHESAGLAKLNARKAA